LETYGILAPVFKVTVFPDDILDDVEKYETKFNVNNLEIRSTHPWDGSLKYLPAAALGRETPSTSAAFDASRGPMEILSKAQHRVGRRLQS
jgi:hypothetical protein